MCGIDAVGIDCSGAYESAVEAYLLKVDIDYDRFYLVMNVNQAVDEERRSKCCFARKIVSSLRLALSDHQQKGETQLDL